MLCHDDEEVWECKLRGIYRLKKTDVLPGDGVVFSRLEDNKGIIEEIKPRRNELYRPPVANIDQVVIITAFAKPEPDLILIDRLLVLIEHNRLRPLILFNKSDLRSDKTTFFF